MRTAAMTCTADAADEYAPGRRLFTAHEYHRLSETEILCPDERLELLEGVIVHMAAMGSSHFVRLNLLAEWFMIRLAGRAVVSIQCSVRLNGGAEPLPDLALLVPPAQRYLEGLPGPDDVLLIIEVSDTTLRRDRQVKLPLYAAAGIPEVWIWDLRTARVFVNRGPVNGYYTQTTITNMDGALTPLAFPDLVLPVRDILG